MPGNWVESFKSRLIAKDYFVTNSHLSNVTQTENLRKMSGRILSSAKSNAGDFTFNAP